MYFVYVDESGDTGSNLLAGASSHFLLSGLVMHELVWHDTLESIIRFRRHLRNIYGLKLREEIHCTDFLHKPGPLSRIKKHRRLLILRDVLDFLEGLSNVNLIHVIVTKAGKPAEYDTFEKAWQALLQRFENTINFKNFPGPKNAKDFGLVIADRTDEPKLRSLARRMRHYNPIPRHSGHGYVQRPIRLLVEDAVHRDSVHSYFLQLVDVAAYFHYQRDAAPCGYVRRKGGRNFFSRLNQVLCQHASKTDPKGIVRL